MHKFIKKLTDSGELISAEGPDMQRTTSVPERNYLLAKMSKLTAA